MREVREAESTVDHMSRTGLDRALRLMGIYPDMMTLAEMSSDEPVKKQYAMCESIECQRQFSGRKIRKNVPKRSRICRECGSPLVWEEEK